MQSRQFQRITWRAAAALLIAIGVADRAGSQAAESWEEHVVLIPTLLVADGRIPSVRSKSKQLSSMTEAPDPFDITLSESVFPLRWPMNQWQGDPCQAHLVLFEYEIGPAPIVLQLIYSSADDSIDEWSNAWDDCTKRQPEWSPLRLAGLATNSRAIPARIVPYVNIAEDNRWFRFRFVYPTISKQHAPAEYRNVQLEVAPLNFQKETNWLDGLRIYRLFVPRMWDESAPRMIVMTDSGDGYDVIEVDATKFSEDYDPAAVAEPTNDRESAFDKWLGKQKKHVPTGFRFGGIEFTR